MKILVYFEIDILLTFHENLFDEDYLYYLFDRLTLREKSRKNRTQNIYNFFSRLLNFLFKFHENLWIK